VSDPAEFGVHLATPSGTVPMGVVSTTERRGRTARIEFAYDSDYLARRARPVLDPAHPLTSGRRVTDTLPRGILDAGPDGWGRRLIQRSRRGDEVTDTGFVLAVDDISRIGALRFAVDGEFVAGTDALPRQIGLDDLADSARAVEDDPDDLAAVRVLLEAGSANLGGVRPKASLTDGGRLTIAKFPSTTDEIDAMAWEKLCLDLAGHAGIPVPVTRLVPAGRGRALLLDRFDRDADGARVPYLSAFAVTDAPDPASGDYLDVAHAFTEMDIADYPASVRALWRRLAFNVAVRNTDDHLKNHGLLWSSAGWALAPAFDITPNPIAGSARTTAIDGETSPAREARAAVALGVDLGIREQELGFMLDAVLVAASGWKTAAAQLGIPERERDRLAAIFEPAQRRLSEELERLR
jgi:serine/threonine-protein kinase HipA